MRPLQHPLDRRGADVDRGRQRRRIEELEDDKRGLSALVYEAGAGKKAVEKQACRALVGVGADTAEARAGETEAVREGDRAVLEKTTAEMAAMQYGLGAAQAMLVIEAGRREQAAGVAREGSANERMS